jgi:hypothetical protein
MVLIDVLGAEMTSSLEEDWLSISVASIRVIVGHWIAHLTC